MDKTDLRPKLVFATNNLHKLDEARAILGDKFQIVSLAEIGCHDDIPETADTLEGNALIKARWVKERYGFDCFADDTGLMVEALGGGPGVFTARYAGEHCTPEQNVSKMLEEMKGESNRRARFSTVLALIKDGETRCFEGSVDGNIATERHGDGGFGYDPIFIADESGKCFAEMTGEQKHAISHRGRAMRKLAAALLTMMILLLIPFGMRAEQWKLHSTFNGEIQKFIDTPDYLYIAGFCQPYNEARSNTAQNFLSLFRYDKNAEEMRGLNSYNVLSDDIVRFIEYNPAGKYLFVSYDNGNIDLLGDDSKAANIPGLKLAPAEFSKNISNVSFYGPARRAYAVTDFGFLEIDDSKLQITRTYQYDKPLRAVGRLGDTLFIGRTDGLYMVALKDAPKEEAWTRVEGINEEIRKIIYAGDRLYVLSGDGWNNPWVNALDLKDGKPNLTKLVNAYIFDMSQSKNGISVDTPNATRTIDESLNVSVTMRPEEFNWRKGTTWDNKDFWFENTEKGVTLLSAKKENDATRWELKSENISPNASSAFKVTNMTYHPDYGILVRNHGNNSIFTDYVLETPDYLCSYRNGEWTPLSAYMRIGDNALFRCNNPAGVAVDPDNPNHIYSSNLYYGLLRLDLENPENSLRLSRQGDPANNERNFIAIGPDSKGWESVFPLSEPMFDSYGNLWTAWYNFDRYSNQIFESTFYCWKPEARRATTDRTDYQAISSIEVPEVSKTGIFQMLVPMHSAASKNILVFHSSQSGDGLTLLDHKGTFDNRSDDTVTTIQSFRDQYGSPIEYWHIMSFCEDTATGNLWACTDHGVFYFKPNELMENGGVVNRIKVARNDGTNLADYLLDGVTVTHTVLDPSGRRWFGTLGGGIVITSADGSEILKTYTTDNSDIPHNDVYRLCYNPDNNSMMAATDKGVAELFLSTATTGPSSGSDIKAYPNPVRPDYFGYVTIEGLADNALVKIVDASGALMKELGVAAGGEIRWDVTNLNSKRVPAGVYYILASGAAEAEAFSAVGKILVIN